MSPSDRVGGVIDQDAETAGHPHASDRAAPARHREGSESARLKQPEAVGEAQAASTQEQVSEKPEDIEADDARPAVRGSAGPFESQTEEFDERRRSRETAAEYNAKLGEDGRAIPSVQSLDTAPASAPDEQGQQTVDDRDEGAVSPVVESRQPDADASYPLPGEEHIPVTRAESAAQARAANAELRGDVREAEIAEEEDAGVLAGFGEPDVAGDASAEASEVAERRDQVSSAAEAPASSEAASQSVTDGTESAETGRVWRDHVADMKAAWADHDTRWPEGVPEGGPPDGEPPDGGRDGSTSADRPGDEPGSWRGDGGQYLNHEENYSVGRVFDRVSSSEPEVSATLQKHEAAVEGAQLVGLEYRIKGEDRFKEKAAERLAIDHRGDPRQAAERIPDALRYTYQIPAEKYTRGVAEISSRLKADGYNLIFCRNSWSDSEYKGINTRWRNAQGQIFEVQFHTPESFEAKQLTHGAYERLRNPTTSRRERYELKEFQRAVSAGIPMPPDVVSVQNYRREGE